MEYVKAHARMAHPESATPPSEVIENLIHHV